MLDAGVLQHGAGMPSPGFFLFLPHKTDRAVFGSAFLKKRYS